MQYDKMHFSSVERAFRIRTAPKNVMADAARICTRINGRMQIAAFQYRLHKPLHIYKVHSLHNIYAFRENFTGITSINFSRCLYRNSIKYIIFYHLNVRGLHVDSLGSITQLSFFKEVYKTN